MPGVASGLQRDVRLVRRRAWIFIPFLIIGIFIAISFRSVAGDANAVASMQLETVVQDLVLGGDRGLRIFEAQSMTGDAEFKKKVVEATGNQNFDYARFSIALTPISVADGVSRGILTVSIQDANKAEAERLRAAFVTVFAQEYTSLDGLFRQRFISKKQAVADLAESDFESAAKALRPIIEAKGLPFDEVVRSQGGDATIIGELNRIEAKNLADTAQINAAQAASGGVTGVQASVILGTTVTNEQAAAALTARKEILSSTIAQIRSVRISLSDVSFDKATLGELDRIRQLGAIKAESYIRLNNAKVAITGAQSSIDTSFSFSGGVAGTLYGRIAVAIAFTIVFGLIAIYGWEWLSQVRSQAKE